MGVNSLPKTVTRQRRDCDLNPDPSVPESSKLNTRLPSHPWMKVKVNVNFLHMWKLVCSQHMNGTELNSSSRTPVLE